LFFFLITYFTVLQAYQKSAFKNITYFLAYPEIKQVIYTQLMRVLAQHGQTKYSKHLFRIMALKINLPAYTLILTKTPTPATN